jgi:tetratricopeptide (TPR) repeat protein
MKMQSWIINFLLVASASCKSEPHSTSQLIRPEAYPALDIPANPDLKEALNWLDTVMKRPDHDIDVALCSMVLARALFPNVDIPREMVKLESLAYECRVLGGASGNARARIASISTFLFNKGYRYLPKHLWGIDARWDEKHCWLHQILSSRDGQCVSLTLLYLALGERMGLNMAAAIAPGHSFVRCIDGDNEFNVEVTTTGHIHDDEYYRRRHGAASSAAYLRSLSRKEHIATLLYSPLGSRLSMDQRHDDALLCLDRATNLFPGFPDAWVNKALVLRALDQPTEALEAYDRALELRPDDSVTWSRRSSVLLELGRHQEARESMDRASRLNPNVRATVPKRDFERALSMFDKALEKDGSKASHWSDRGSALGGLKRYEEAIASYKKALEHKPWI